MRPIEIIALIAAGLWFYYKLIEYLILGKIYDPLTPLHRLDIKSSDEETNVYISGKAAQKAAIYEHMRLNNTWHIHEFRELDEHNQEMGYKGDELSVGYKRKRTT